MGGDQVGRPEPGCQRQLGTMQDSSGRDRSLTPTPTPKALEGVRPRPKACAAAASASRADEARRPAVANEKFGAGSLVGELDLELGK